MAGQVFFSVSMSLDGFIAPESLGDLMGQQWMELQQWVFPQRFFRENLELGAGGEEGRDNDILRETHLRTGASVMGKRMFEAGEQAWPEDAPFHTPVFVVTHEKREPWERPGGTTFHFVNDGIETALDLARDAAGDRDVRVAGGGATILEYVNAGLVDEFSIALSPVLFGSGIRLFEGVDAGRVALEQVRAEPSTERDAPDLRRPGSVADSVLVRRASGAVRPTGRASRWRGRFTVKVDPTMCSETTEMSPPYPCTIESTMVRPRPEPWIACSWAVEDRKNRVNSSACSSCGIPRPLSLTSSRTLPATTRRRQRTQPPSLVNFRALVSRFDTTDSKFCTSPCTITGPRGTSKSTSRFRAVITGSSTA